MELASLVVSGIALLVATDAAVYRRQQAKATKDQVRLSERQDHLARTPRLTIELPSAAGRADTSVAYVIHNDGPQDLDSIIVYQPEVLDRSGVRYPVAPMGGDFAESADLGPIRMGEEKVYVLLIGGADGLPEFRVSVESRRHGDAPWRKTIKLDTARSYPQVFRLPEYGPRPSRPRLLHKRVTVWVFSQPISEPARTGRRPSKISLMTV